MRGRGRQQRRGASILQAPTRWETSKPNARRGRDARSRPPIYIIVSENPSMPDLTIRLKRHPDHTASLTCTRRDGSVTWQRQRGSLGAVFPPHDLTHYAVEQTLGFQHGFYGLIADGWAIEDFAKPWPRGPIPPEAQEVELIVGFFDTERRGDV